MKRYLVFAGADYYPQSEAGDFIKAFDTAEEALHVRDVLLAGDEYEFCARDNYATHWASVHYLRDNGDLEIMQ